MLKLIIVGTIAAMVAAKHPINHEIVKKIRSSTHLWEAHEPEENPLRFMSHEELRSLLGTHLVPKMEAHKVEKSLLNVPATFDSRNAFPGCVHPIRNQ